MSPSPVRKNDAVACDEHGDGHVITADASVTFEDQEVARAGDTVKYKDDIEKPIEEGNACVIVNGKRLALVGDKAESGGALKTGASSIKVDEGEPFVFIGKNVHIGKNVSFITGSSSSALSDIIDVTLGAVTMIAGVAGDEICVGEVAQIAGYKLTKHALERMAERKVTKEAIKDALEKPLKIKPPKVDAQGRISQRYVGKEAEVAVNPKNGNIVSVNPTDSNVIKKILEEIKK